MNQGKTNFLAKKQKHSLRLLFQTMALVFTLILMLSIHGNAQSGEYLSLKSLQVYPDSKLNLNSKYNNSFKSNTMLWRGPSALTMDIHGACRGNNGLAYSSTDANYDNCIQDATSGRYRTLNDPSKSMLLEVSFGR